MLMCALSHGRTCSWNQVVTSLGVSSGEGSETYRRVEESALSFQSFMATGIAYKAGHSGPSSGGLEIVSYRGWAVTIPSVKGPSVLTSVGLALCSASAWKIPFL